MGLRMNIPLPGPFSYSVGPPKVGRAVRAVGKAGKVIAKDARQCREARAAQRGVPPPYNPVSPPQYGPNYVRPAPQKSTVGAIMLGFIILALVAMSILGQAGFRL